MIERGKLYKNLAELEEHNPDSCQIVFKCWEQRHNTVYVFQTFDEAVDWVRSVDLSDVETLGITVVKRDQKIEHMIAQMDTILAEQEMSGADAAPTAGRDARHY